MSNSDKSDQLLTSERGGGHTTKTGRKGDPRMHRAVAARMRDPNMTLFDALRVGGFEYPADDDAGCVDSENVTLGQRKNQLSRRLRLARKQCNYDNSDASYSNNSHEIGNDNGKVSGNKRSHRDDDLSENDASEENNEQHPPNAIMAKFHPQYHPIIVPTRPPAKISTTSPLYPDLLNPPNFSHIAPPNGNSFRPNGSVHILPHANTIHHTFPHGPNAGHYHNHTHSPSGVAIASLNATAQSVGLTLEQLAVTLQSKRNLAQVLASASETSKQQELAIHLFHSESRALYQKCMISKRVHRSIYSLP
jgi:hypothetical protein